MTEEARTGAGSELRQSLAETVRRIEGILEEAERAASEIQAEAEAEASRYAEERRREADRLTEERLRLLSGLSSSLLDHARRISQQSEGMSRALEDAVAGREGAGDGQSAVSAVSGIEAAAPARAQSAEAGRWAGTSGGGVRREAAPVREEALLRATQMAVAGRSRAEIETALGVEFGIADPAAVLDQILGRSG